MIRVTLTDIDLATSDPFGLAIRRAVRAAMGELAAEGLALGRAGVTLRDGRRAPLPPAAEAAYQQWRRFGRSAPLSFDLDFPGGPP